MNDIRRPTRMEWCPTGQRLVALDEAGTWLVRASSGEACLWLDDAGRVCDTARRYVDPAPVVIAEWLLDVVVPGAQLPADQVSPRALGLLQASRAGRGVARALGLAVTIPVKPRRATSSELPASVTLDVAPPHEPVAVEVPRRSGRRVREPALTPKRQVSLFGGFNG